MFGHIYILPSLRPWTHPWLGICLSKHWRLSSSIVITSPALVDWYEGHGKEGIPNGVSHLYDNSVEYSRHTSKAKDQSIKRNRNDWNILNGFSIIYVVPSVYIYMICCPQFWTNEEDGDENKVYYIKILYFSIIRTVFCPSSKSSNSRHQWSRFHVVSMFQSYSFYHRIPLCKTVWVQKWELFDAGGREITVSSFNALITILQILLCSSRPRSLSLFCPFNF